VLVELLVELDDVEELVDDEVVVLVVVAVATYSMTSLGRKLVVA
jgi:hypothetical protein